MGPREHALCARLSDGACEGQRDAAAAGAEACGPGCGEDLCRKL